MLPVVLGLGGLYFVVVLALTLGFLAYTSTAPGPGGAGPLLSGSPAGGSGTGTVRSSTSFWSFFWKTGEDHARPFMGGMYACETCRGYPNGSHYSRDSWRWID